MISALQELETLGLENIDSEGKVPESRLKSAAALRAIHSQNRRDDEGSAINRARVQAMLDGEPPYNQAALNANGQGARANANFLQGRTLLNRINNGYLDMVTSVKQLMSISVEYGEPAERHEYNRIITEELTRTIRKWDAFQPRFMRLVDLFNTHGVGIAFWPDPKDFRFSVCGFGDMLVPRQTEATACGIEIATAEKHMTVTELYGFIKDEAKAASQGWNVPAVKQAIHRAVTSTTNYSNFDIEASQREVKNNDFLANRKFQHVKVVCGYVREFGGKITYAMAEKDHEGPFLCLKPNEYNTVDEAFVFFCYGVGNGTYHGIRGFGHLIYPTEQLINRTINTAFDLGTTGVMLESESANAEMEMSIRKVGAWEILPKGFSLAQGTTSLPNMSQTLYPLLDRAKNMLGESGSQFAAPQAGVYQNEDSVNAQLEQLAGNDNGAIDLFYGSLDRVIRTMVKRIVKGPKSDPLVAEFHRRIEARGITPDILKSIDHDNTYAFRAYGAGSPAVRALAHKQLLTLLPNLDETGQQHLLHDVISDIVGPVIADKFRPAPTQPRMPAEAKTAWLENSSLARGEEVPVFPSEMHATHAMQHMPFINQRLDAIERGQLDPMQELPGLQMMLAHLSEHGNALAADPSQKAMFGMVKETINNMGQVVTNMERKIKAEQRKAAEAGGGEAQPGGEDQIAQMELASREFDLFHKQRMAELEYSGKQAEFQQRLALNDLKGAQQVQLSQRYPQTKYQERR